MPKSGVLLMLPMFSVSATDSRCAPRRWWIPALSCVFVPRSSERSVSARPYTLRLTYPCRMAFVPEHHRGQYAARLRHESVDTRVVDRGDIQVDGVLARKTLQAHLRADVRAAGR